MISFDEVTLTASMTLESLLGRLVSKQLSFYIPHVLKCILNISVTPLFDGSVRLQINCQCYKFFVFSLTGCMTTSSLNLAKNIFFQCTPTAVSNELKDSTTQTVMIKTLLFKFILRFFTLFTIYNRILAQ